MNVESADRNNESDLLKEKLRAAPLQDELRVIAPLTHDDFELLESTVLELAEETFIDSFCSGGDGIHAKLQFSLMKLITDGKRLHPESTAAETVCNLATAAPILELFDKNFATSGVDALQINIMNEGDVLERHTHCGHFVGGASMCIQKPNNGGLHIISDSCDVPFLYFRREPTPLNRGEMSLEHSSILHEVTPVEGAIPRISLIWGLK